MKNKIEVHSIFLQFEALISRQFNTKILAFHSDWGGEYQHLHTSLKQKGIFHHIACPYTHEQNGMAERKICHLVDTALTLFAHANLPKMYWNYAVEQTINQCSSL
jgi:transposase InsO family protein